MDVFFFFFLFGVRMAKVEPIEHATNAVRMRIRDLWETDLLKHQLDY